jgi:MFS family permease
MMKERLWSLPFVQLTAAMLVLFTGFYSLLPTLPLYVKEIGGNETDVGLVMGAYTLSAVICRPLVGGLMDRYGRRTFILWGLAAFAVAMYSYDWAGAILMLLALRVLHGMSWASSTTAISTAVTDIIPASRRGEGMGWFGLATTLAMAIGPLLGIWVMERWSFPALFLFGSVLAVVAFLLAVTTRMAPRPASDGRRVGFYEPSVLPVTAAIFFLSIAYSGITTFLPLFAEQIAVNSGTFFLVYAITLTLIRPVTGKLSDIRGEGSVIIPGIIVTIGSLVLLSQAEGLAIVVISAILFGIGFGSTTPALQAATLRLAPPERRGVANAAFMTAFDLGLGIGAILLGWMSQHTGYAAVFTAGASSAAASFAIFAIFVTRALKRREHVDG